MQKLLWLAVISLITNAYEIPRRIPVRIEHPLDQDEIKHTLYSYNTGSKPVGSHRGDSIRLKSAENRYADYYDNLDGRIPLRDAVEHIPFEGEMTILLKSAAHKDEEGPFSRGSVEAFPIYEDEPSVMQYSSFHNEETNSYITEVSEFQPMIGYRGDVESDNEKYSVDNLDYFRRSFVDRNILKSVWEEEGHLYSPSKYSSKAGADSAQYIRTPYSSFRNKDPEYKLVCYVESWASYRAEPMRFTASDVDPYACTHLIYSFAGIDDNDFTIKSLQPRRDIIEGAYKSMVGLKKKNPDLKVMISVGGWQQSGRTFSKMAASPLSRKKFIHSVTDFLTEYGFDGLDLNWEQPGSTDRGGRSVDKRNLVTLTQELNDVLKQHYWILSMATPISRGQIKDGYDLRRLSSSVDFFNLKAFDLRGAYSGIADHHAPIGPRNTDSYLFNGLNLADGVKLFVNEGVPKSKIVPGVPFYGRSYILSNPYRNEPGSYSNFMGPAHKYSAEKGYVSHFEICMALRNGGWHLKTDYTGTPYMYKDDHWIGYDSEEYVAQKAKFVLNEELGGIMVWALDLDDFIGLCGTKWPLMSAIRRTLYSPKTSTLFSSEKEDEDLGVRVEEISSMDVSKPSEDEITAEMSIQQGSMEGDKCDPVRAATKSIASSCTGFLVCVLGKYMKVRCPEGLLFDSGVQKCLRKENANCAPVTQSLPVVKPISPQQHPSVVHDVILETAPKSKRLSGDYKVVCYFANWSWYRKGKGKFMPEDTDPGLCTHVIYAFAVLDYTNLIIKPHDSWTDIDNKFYERIVAMKKTGVKVMVAIGGWNDSQGDKYSRLVSSPFSRQKFINHVIGFIQQNGFDGLDLDWEYPVCWRVDCGKGPGSDRDNFAIFVEELNRAFKPLNLLLSAAVSPNKKVIDLGYDVPRISRSLDWISVMTFDFHGHWDKQTGHHAPMYYHPDDSLDYFNMDFAIRYWIRKGTPSRKLVMGMPLYGRSFTLNDPAVNGLNSPASTKGIPGKLTREPGFVAYNEICEHILMDNWNVVQDPEKRMGPYAYKNNQWISYDDVGILKLKSKYIRDMNLAGGMVWALDLDDFRNTCGQGRYPLLNTIASVLAKPRVGYSDPIDQPVQEITQQEVGANQFDKKPSDPTTAGEVTRQKGAKKVVCYYTNWSAYRPGEGKYLPSDIDTSLCTHVIYAFAVLDPTSLTIKPHDSWKDIDSGYYKKVSGMKRKKGAPKVLIAIGGWNDSKGPKYSKLVNDPAARKKFNQHVLEFTKRNNFDGLDLDWEYPKCWHVQCNKGPASDKPAFTAWIRELSALFKPEGLLLSAAVSPNYKVIDAGYDVPALSQYLDFISVMTYDFHGHWDKGTGHVAPMYRHSKTIDNMFNVDSALKYWVSKGADKSKIIVGMPMYGQSFTLVDSGNNGLNAKHIGGGTAGQYTRAKGFLSYYEICHKIKHSGWKVIRDPEGAIGPYAYKGNQWVGFDDDEQIRYKSQYVIDNGYGGAMIWALDLDDYRNMCGCEQYPLLKTINRVLRNYNVPDPKCKRLGGLIGDKPYTKPFVPPEPEEIYPEVPEQFLPERQPVEPSIQDQTPADMPITPGSYGKAGSPCNHGQFFKHKACNKFYECYKKKQVELICFGNSYYDGNGKCTDRNRVKCVGIREDHVSPPVQIQPRPKPKPVVTQIHIRDEEKPKDKVKIDQRQETCSSGQYKAHPSDCSKYYRCVHGVFQEETCASSLHYDPQSNTCNWPHIVKCSASGGKPTKQKPTKQKPTEQKQKPVKPSTVPPPPVTQVTQWTKPATPWWTPPSSAKPITGTTENPWAWKPPTEAPYVVPPSKAIGETGWKAPIDGYKVVCYFTNWAWYRRGLAKYKPEDIDSSMCTHVLYGFAVLNPSQLTIKPHDTWADYDNRFYAKVTALKSRGVKVLLALGGWNDSLGSKYSKLVNDPSARKRFIDHALQFLEKHNFDGLDLDWEYPVCWQVDCTKGPASDKEGFTAWIRELSAAFKPRGLLLTAAVSPSYKVVDLGYDVPALSQYLDFINVMTYDYHGHWDKRTGHVAPLYHHPESSVPEFNANYSINYWIQHGADRRKIIMGMPMYGQAFTITNTKNTGLNSVGSKGQAGQFTRAAGFLAYYEICHMITKQGFQVVRDVEGRIGPYAHKGNQWVGFDDVDQIRRKAEYIKSMGLGGGMIWALDLDDFNNRCGCERHPLLREINRSLRGFPKSARICKV